MPLNLNRGSSEQGSVKVAAIDSQIARSINSEVRRSSASEPIEGQPDQPQVAQQFDINSPNEFAPSSVVLNGPDMQGLDEPIDVESPRDAMDEYEAEMNEHI